MVPPSKYQPPPLHPTTFLGDTSELVGHERACETRASLGDSGGLDFPEVDKEAGDDEQYLKEVALTVQLSEKQEKERQHEKENLCQLEQERVDCAIKASLKDVHPVAPAPGESMKVLNADQG